MDDVLVWQEKKWGEIGLCDAAHFKYRVSIEGLKVIVSATLQAEPSYHRPTWDCKCPPRGKGYKYTLKAGLNN